MKVFLDLKAKMIVDSQATCNGASAWTRYQTAYEGPYPKKSILWSQIFSLQLMGRSHNCRAVVKVIEDTKNKIELVAKPKNKKDRFTRW